MGPFHFAAPMMQAGLAGYSDRAMRLVARRRGCPYAVTEAMLDRTLLAGGRGLANSIDINDEDHPVAGQIMGSDASEVASAAKILAERGYDVIDLNFACPVKKVRNKARGGWLLKDAAVGLAILRKVRAVLPSHPLSLSLRRGFDDDAQSEERFWQLCATARELGFVAVRVHARTVEQKYAGRSRGSFLAEVKRAFPDWCIWGSGDVFEPQDVVSMLSDTGVDGVWIARGAIGNPWIFGDAKKLLESKAAPWEGTRSRGPSEQTALARTGASTGDVRGKSTVVGFQAGDPASRFSAASSDGPPGRGPSSESLIPPPTVAEQREALEEHFEIAMQIHGESLAGRRMRKIGIKYARFHPLAHEVKKGFIAVASLADWQAVLREFYSQDAPGVRPRREVVDEVNDEAMSCEPQEITT